MGFSYWFFNYDRGEFFPFSSFMSSSYQNGRIIIFGPFANLISNLKDKSPVFSSNSDFFSYHSFCKLRVLVLLCFRLSHSQPLSSYLTSMLSGLTAFAISSVTIVNLPRFSVAWFKDLKARHQRLHYGRRADPCGAKQSHFPHHHGSSVMLVKGVHF